MSSCLPGKEQFVFMCCSCLPPVLCVFNKPRHNEPRHDVPRPRTTQQLAPGWVQEDCAKENLCWHPTQHWEETEMTVSC